MSIHDPHADLEEAFHNYNINLIPWTKLEKKYDSIIFSVPHEFYLQNSLNILNKIKKKVALFLILNQLFLNLILKIKILKYGHFKN